METVLRHVGYLQFLWLVWPLVKQEASVGAGGWREIVGYRMGRN